MCRAIQKIFFISAMCLLISSIFAAPPQPNTTTYEEKDEMTIISGVYQLLVSDSNFYPSVSHVLLNEKQNDQYSTWNQIANQVNQVLLERGYKHYIGLSKHDFIQLVKKSIYDVLLRKSED